MHPGPPSVQFCPTNHTERHCNGFGPVCCLSTRCAAESSRRALRRECLPAVLALCHFAYPRKRYTYCHDITAVWRECQQAKIRPGPASPASPRATSPGPRRYTLRTLWFLLLQSNRPQAQPPTSQGYTPCRTHPSPTGGAIPAANAYSAKARSAIARPCPSGGFSLGKGYRPGLRFFVSNIVG